MKQLLKVILVLASIFASTFLLINLSGLITKEDVQLWLKQATAVDPLYVIAIVLVLLIADIIIAVPTLTITILSGYFLGPLLGGATASTGMLVAGLIGYGLSLRFGERILKIIIRSKEKRDEAKNSFKRYGLGMILLSRSSPIFPEVCACMAGMTGMKFSRFLIAWSISCVPYAFIAAFSGSISSFNDPMPAIYTSIALYAMLWTSWFVFRKREKLSSIQQ